MAGKAPSFSWNFSEKLKHLSDILQVSPKVFNLKTGGGIDSSQPRVLSDSAGLGADTALLWLGAMLRAWPAHTWVEGLGGGGQG